MARRYVLTAKRRAALKKAALISARKRKRRRVKRVATVGALGAVAAGSLIAGKRVSTHVKVFKGAKEFQSSGFDPESGYGPGRAKYTYREHIGYRRSIYKSHRTHYRREIGRIITGKPSKHPLMNGIVAMQMQSGRYRYLSKPKKLVKATRQHHKRMMRYRSDPTL